MNNLKLNFPFNFGRHSESSIQKLALSVNLVLRYCFQMSAFQLLSVSAFPQTQTIQPRNLLRIRIAFVIITVTVAATIVISDLRRRAAARRLREAILAELQPVVLQNCALKRFGSANDGGYLMCENLIEQLDAAYSYGVGSNDDWGCEVSRWYDVPVPGYDCFDPARPCGDGGTFVFHNECVGNRSGYAGSHVFDTMENQIRKNGDTGRRLIIKMDIEGGEWDSLLAAPDELLASIPQITMEMHGFDDPKIVEVLRKLKRNFYLVNLHFNNWSCTPKAAPLPA